MTSSVSWTSWLGDMEQDDCSFIPQSNTSLLEENTRSRSFSTENHSSYSTMRNSSVAESSLERPSKSPKICSASNTTETSEEPSQLKPAASYSSRSYILSFEGNANPPPVKAESSAALKPKRTLVLNQGKSLLFSKNEAKCVFVQEGKKAGSVTRSPHSAHDHTIAERMRREKISQQFIALSALVPDLKKMDKASVLGDAINYVKQLQERVKLLKEQSKKRGVESVVYVKKKSLLSSTGDEDVSNNTSSNSCDGNSDDSSIVTKMSLPEVEARVSEKSVLIRIHCEKQNAVMASIIEEIENLHLSVVNSSALIFGSSVWILTFIAEMEDEFSMNVTELARNLKVGLLQFM